MLLRRTALTAYPLSFNASIKGNDWLQWLDSVCPALGNQFSTDIGQLLLRSAYEKNPQVDVTQLHQLSSKWINLHRNFRQKNAQPKNPKTTAEASHV